MKIKTKNVGFELYENTDTLIIKINDKEITRMKLKEIKIKFITYSAKIPKKIFVNAKRGDTVSFILYNQKEDIIIADLFTYYMSEDGTVGFDKGNKIKLWLNDYEV